MVKVKPFAAIRPPKEIVSDVASRPYDVLNSVEAKAEATEKSLLHIIKPEIDFDPIIDEHTTEAYNKAVENFKLWQQRGWLIQDKKECYYIYAQTMEGRTQYGLVLGANVQDYLTGKIKKHELTRKDKEEDRMIHVRIQNANVEPVFFAYPDNNEINEIVLNIVKSKSPEYDFVAEDGFGHHFWVIDDEKTITSMLQMMLERRGYQLTTVNESPAALALFEKDPSAFDLLITDMTMPIFTGFDLARKVLAIRPEMPIILITGFSELINKEKANAAGIREFLMKPATSRDLAECVRRVLDGK